MNVLWNQSGSVRRWVYVGTGLLLLGLACVRTGSALFAGQPLLRPELLAHSLWCVVAVHLLWCSRTFLQRVEVVDEALMFKASGRTRRYSPDSIVSVQCVMRPLVGVALLSVGWNDGSTVRKDRYRIGFVPFDDTARQEIEDFAIRRLAKVVGRATVYRRSIWNLP